MLARVRRAGLSLPALTAGLLALWAIALAGSAAALPSNCSQSGSTVTCTFGYTGANQTWQVPSGLSSASFEVQGAQGGNITVFTTGGLGGQATANLSLTPGATVTLVVGGQGGSNSGCGASAGAGGFNGGAAGGGGTCAGAGGGGASDVRVGGSALSNRVLVAGGGGGAANLSGSCGLANGGAGGGLNGASGTDPNCGSNGGSGGNQTGTSGSGNLGNGSVGATGTGFFANAAGGGGGGGYYGGAGGGQAAGGGGGSGFGPTGTAFQTGARSGDGQIVITYSLATTSTGVSAPAHGTAGTAIAPGSISATLSGATGAASGTITFTVFGPQSSAPTSCTTGGTTVGTATVSGSGTYHPSAGFTPPSAGTYWWYASYSGDGGNQPSNSPCASGMVSTVVSPKAPAVVTGAASGVAHTAVTLNGTVNPNGAATTYYFQYGTSTAYGKHTGSQTAGSDATTHAEKVVISGLTPGTTYHYRIVAVNAGGTSEGADHTFTTPKRPLKLSVSPTRTQAGTQACFAFEAASTGHPVGGVTIHLAGHTTRTSAAGNATICLTPHPGSYHPSATKRGYRTAHTTITTTAPSPTPNFTG